MISSAISLVAALLLSKNVVAKVAPEITTVVEGYNIIAKLPCKACPFIYQDTSRGSDEPWKTREDENALVC